MNCSRCKVYKELSQFYKSTRNRIGYRYECKECTKIHKLISIKNTGLDGYIKKLYTDTNSRCKKTKGRISNNLDIKDIKERFKEQNGICALSGITMTYERGNGRTHTNLSIDRIDSKKDYTKDNIQLVCNVINTMKWDLEEKEFINYCRLISNSLKK